MLWPKSFDAPPPGGACYTILGETAQSSSMRDALASPTPLPSYSRREIVLRRLDQVERQQTGGRTLPPQCGALRNCAEQESQRAAVTRRAAERFFRCHEKREAEPPSR